MKLLPLQMKSHFAKSSMLGKMYDHFLHIAPKYHELRTLILDLSYLLQTS